MIATLTEESIQSIELRKKTCLMIAARFADESNQLIENKKVDKSIQDS